MAYVLKNRVKQALTATGSGALLVDGAVATGFRGLSSVLSNGDFFRGLVIHRSANEWQAGIWSYSGGSITLERFEDSSTGSAITFSAGTKDVEIDPVVENQKWLTFAGAATIYPFDFIDGNTSGGSFDLTMIAAPSDGDKIWVNDARGTWATNPLTVQGNGKNIQGGFSTGTFITLNTPAMVRFAYHNNIWHVR